MQAICWFKADSEIPISLNRNTEHTKVCNVFFISISFYFQKPPFAAHSYTPVGHTHKYSARFPVGCDALRLGGLHRGGGGGGLLGVFALVLAQSGQTALGATLQDGLAVLVHLQLDDHALMERNSEY